MKISVIIAAYSRKNYLLNAVKSVADQTLSKDLYEVVVVKNFEDKQIDDYIRRLGFKNIVYDTPKYGEQVAVGIEESSGDVLAFLEDDDEFEREKLSEVYKTFSQYKDISYFHDSRKFLYYDRPVDANVGDASIKSIIDTDEKLMPHYDVALDPFDETTYNFLLYYPRILATVSLMSAKKECIEDRLDLLKKISFSVEGFIPAFAAECGLLYHTGKRLTRYRIHARNTSIPFTSQAQIRTLMYFARSIEDHKLILSNTSPGNRVRDFIRMNQLTNKLTLYYAPDHAKRLLHYGQNALGAFKDVLELCKLRRCSLRCCVLDLLGALYYGMPTKPIDTQTLRKALRRGTHG